MAPIIIAVLSMSASAAALAPRLALDLRLDRRTLSAELTFRASGTGDVYFRSDAVRLEIRYPDGTPLRTVCLHRLALPKDPVRLSPGRTLTTVLDLSCYRPELGVRYELTAVLSDSGDDFRDKAPPGAIWVTGPIRSNRIFAKLQEPIKALQRMIVPPRSARAGGHR